MAQITLENVAVGHEGKVVLDHVSFAVNAGDYLCVVGENGSGKSTLIKTLLHLLPPLGGTIRLGDGLSAQEIGYLPQQTAIQRDFPASVIEIVLSGCLNNCSHRPFFSKAQKELAEQNLEKLRISHLRKSCYRELSGGQQQRVLLARALCATRKMLLLDEPVAGLDPTATADMYSLIERLNHEDGITVIMISHDIPSAVKYGSHILHIGTPFFFGTTEEYCREFSTHGIPLGGNR